MVDLPYWTVVNLLRGILSPVCRIEIRGTREVPAGPWDFGLQSPESL